MNRRNLIILRTIFGRAVCKIGLEALTSIIKWNNMKEKSQYIVSTSAITSRFSSTMKVHNSCVSTNVGYCIIDNATIIWVIRQQMPCTQKYFCIRCSVLYWYVKIKLCWFIKVFEITAFTWQIYYNLLNSAIEASKISVSKNLPFVNITNLWSHKEYLKIMGTTTKIDTRTSINRLL